MMTNSGSIWRLTFDTAESKTESAPSLTLVVDVFTGVSPTHYFYAGLLQALWLALIDIIQVRVSSASGFIRFFCALSGWARFADQWSEAVSGAGYGLSCPVLLGFIAIFIGVGAVLLYCGESGVGW
jgi:hypothetical protein